jgi:hypothetical protein
MKSYLMLFIVLCSLCGTLIAQDGATPPTRRWQEVGIRSGHWLFSRYRFEEAHGTLRENRLRNWNVEGYAIRYGNRHSFIRLSLGLSSDSQWSRLVTASPALDRVSETDDQEQTITTSISHGWELKPVPRRLHVRAGFSLAHRLQVHASHHVNSMAADSSGNTTLEDYTNRQVGMQELQLKVFGQVNFRLWKGLWVGLEWQLGPSKRFGIVNFVNSGMREENGVVEVDFRNEDLRLVSERVKMEMKVWSIWSLGWRF